MKPFRLMSFSLLGLMLAINAGAGSLQSRFELMHPIDSTFRIGEQGKIVVANDVFGQARSFPNDLRVFSADGIQWPFFLFVPPADADTQSLGLEILNRSWVHGLEPYLQFDVVIPKVNGEQPVHNQLELSTTGSDFVRRVDIFSGDPKGHMASGYLIDFSRQRDARNRLIRYPDSDAVRLHVQIYPNAQAADETFEIASINLQYRTSIEVERDAVAFIDCEREREEKAQTRILDLGQTGRPIEFITFEVADDSYARCVSVYGRDSEHDPWRRVGGGEIHALPSDREDTVKLHARHRFLKVQVFHYDDLPLEIQSIRLEAIPRYLVFEATTEGKANLCFRGWDIEAPRYDLRGRIKHEAIEGLPVFRTLDTVPNAAAKTHWWRKYTKLLGALAVGAVSLLVVWIIISMLRQQTKAEG